MAVAVSLSLPDEEATLALGEAWGRKARPGDVFALTGELGAGKTTLIQALARGLEVPESARVRSPTFSLLDIHSGRIPFYHLDFYRLADASELEELGLAEVFDSSGVAAVEWANLFSEEIPQDALWVHLTRQVGGSRIVLLRGEEEDYWREVAEEAGILP